MDWLMEEAQRLAMAQRITKLRERSPWAQPVIADKLGIGLRAYQKLEARGTTKHERCEELAAIHLEWAAGTSDYAHLSADWIWDGRVEAPPVDRTSTPDPFAGAPVSRAQLDRIEQKLDAILAIATAQPSEALELLAKLGAAADQQDGKQGRGTPPAADAA